MTAEYKIEKGIPMPEKNPPPGRVCRFPFAQLEIGDSFLVPEVKLKSIRQTCFYYGKKLGRKFTSAEVEGGVRVWRRT
jgi:hypothetical protein